MVEELNKKITIDISKGWLPDYVPFGLPAGGLITARNIYPYTEKYMPAKQAVVYSTNAVSGIPLFAKEFLHNGTTKYLFIGTTTGLYRLETTRSFTDVSKLSTTYTTASNRWYFEQYGEWIIATNYNDAPQILKGLTAANFTDLGGSPPKAKYCMLFNGFLILGYINDGTVYPKKIVWSDLENVEIWTHTSTNLADSATLADADGEVTGLAPVGSMFAVFHKNSITIGWFSSGAPYAFSFAQNRYRNVGAIPGSIVSVGNDAYFWDSRQFYRLGEDGLEPIGDGVKNAVIDVYKVDYDYRISTAVDSRRGLIFWSFPTTSGDGTPNRILCYNYIKKIFTDISLNHHCIFNMTRAALDMDSMDSFYPSMDAISSDYHMDSNFWLGISPISIVDTDKKVATLTGDAMTGTMETGEVSTGDIIQVTNVRPLIQNATDTVTVNIGKRFKENDSVTYTSDTTVGSNGLANLRATGRYLRCKLTTGLHEGIQSIVAEGIPAGVR